MIFWFSARQGSHWLAATAQDPVEVVEAPAVRPAVERSGRALLPVRGQVPLAERCGAVAVLPQDPGQRRTVPRQQGRVAGEAVRELADRAEADRVAVATGQQGGAGRRAQRRHVEAVVSQPALGHPRVVRRLDRPAERARVAEPGVIDQHDQHVRRAGRRVDVVDLGPVRLGTVQSAGQGPAELRAPDRELRAIWPAHVTPSGSGIVRGRRLASAHPSVVSARAHHRRDPACVRDGTPAHRGTTRRPGGAPRARRPHPAKSTPARCHPCREPSHSPCSPAEHPRTSRAPPARGDSSRSWRVSARATLLRDDRLVLAAADQAAGSGDGGTVRRWRRPGNLTHGVPKFRGQRARRLVPMG